MQNTESRKALSESTPAVVLVPCERAFIRGEYPFTGLRLLA